MGYQALLFCPDEKTARTVTQVLGELEFNVESCIEPFAAVKKLMGEHFDAVVVDCDNEQNATLLFKSARNSTSNQASLAVAVVEGQAGVAKAFRIGANLVLTKPINVEQAKGTLRVARGLLRKGEPGKPAAPAAAPPAATASAPAPIPAKPAAPRPVPTLRPAAPVAAAAASTPRPVAPPVAKPHASPVSPTQASAASSAPVVHDEALPEINGEDSSATPLPAAPVAPPAFKKAAPVSQVPKLPVPAAPVKSVFKTPPPAAPVSTLGSGAASAPAPAREAQGDHVAETPAPSAANAAALFDKPAVAVHGETHASTPSFTFGGVNAPVETSGGSKKILLGVGAGVLVIVGLYFAWAHFQGRASEPVSNQTLTAPAPAAAPPTAKPSNAQPAPASTTAITSAPSAGSPAASQPAALAGATSNVAEDTEPAPEKDTRSVAPSSKKPSSAAPPASKEVSSASPADVPRVMKGGAVPVVNAKPGVADAPAPSVIGIAAPGSGGALSSLVGGEANEPAPVLQKLNISQGVSQGLLIKKVAPSYPASALRMRIEGPVELLATVSKSGDITAVKILSGEQLLTRAAADAVKQWKYKPYLLNGEPVEIQTQITVNFKLPH